MSAPRSRLSRREFLQGCAGAGTVLLAAACSTPVPAAAPTAAPAAPTAAPVVAPTATPAAQAALRPAPPTAAPPTKLVMSFSDRTTSDLALFLAKEQKLFDRQNLDVDLQFIASSTGIAALAADQTQFALIGGPEALGAVVGGADLVAIIQLSGAQPYLMEVAPTIKTIDDLRGKKIGVSTIGSSSDTATRISLRSQGIDPEKDVTIVAVGSLENRMSAMANGAVDAGLGSPPETLKLEDAGLHPLFDLSTIDMPPLAQCLIVKRSTITTQRDVVQRVVNAIVQGTVLQKKDRAIAQATLRTWANLTDQRELDVAYDYWTGHILRIPPALKAAEWQGFIDELGKRNERAVNFDPSTMIDNHFVDTAAANGLAA